MSETHWIKGKILRETDKAILFEHESGEQVWLPLSQIEDFEDADWQQRQPTSIEVTDWIARQKGLVE